MKVGYGKLGRSVLLDPRKWGVVGGDCEPYRVLKLLAESYPSVEWWVLGKNSGEDPKAVGLPPNVVNPWSWGKIPRAPWEQVCRATTPLFEQMDGHLWWIGQHGGANSPIPQVRTGEPTSPLASFLNYGAFVVRGLNAWRDAGPVGREEVWMVSDIRNTLKARDLKWPVTRPILSQRSYSSHRKAYRYGDATSPLDYSPPFRATVEGDHWLVAERYEYSGLDVVALDPQSLAVAVFPGRPYAGRESFGILTNELNPGEGTSRREYFPDWVLPLSPSVIGGKWSESGVKYLEDAAHQWLPVCEIPYADVHRTLSSLKSTVQLAYPGVKGSFFTPKFWECAMARCVSFFHPDYNDQGHVIPTLDGRTSAHTPEENELAYWLRVETPEELRARVQEVNESKVLWQHLTDLQLAVLWDHLHRKTWQSTVESRLRIKGE